MTILPVIIFILVFVPSIVLIVSMPYLTKETISFESPSALSNSTVSRCVRCGSRMLGLVQFYIPSYSLLASYAYSTAMNIRGKSVGSLSPMHSPSS